MSSIFDQAYDEMTLDEVIYRLPGELAVSAFKRRVKTAEDILEILKVSESKSAASELSVREHINDIIANMPIEDLVKVDEKYHPRMFKWLNKSNTDRIKEYGVDYISTKLLFNITDPDEHTVWEALLQKTINASPINKTYIARIAEKIDSDYFGSILNIILSNSRPEVRSAVLQIQARPNVSYITEQQLILGLKAYAKCTPSETYEAIRLLDWEWLKQLKAQERFFVIKNYLTHMPEFQKLKVFKNQPSFDEFKNYIFPASIQFNEEFNQLLERYSKVTQEDAPVVESESDPDDTTAQLTPNITPIVADPIVVQNVDQLSENQWYFQDDYSDDDDADYFTFIRKSIWDVENRVDDFWSDAETLFLENHIVQAGIEKERLMECVYECNGDDVQSAVDYLKAKGFIKKRCVKR